MVTKIVINSSLVEMEAKSLKAWLTLITMADKNGELEFTLSSLSATLGLSIQQVRTLLNNKQNNKQITLKSTNRCSTLTICNYDSYILEKNTHQQTNNKRITNEITNETDTIDIKSKITKSKQDIITQSSKSTVKSKSSSSINPIVPSSLSSFFEGHESLIPVMEEWLAYKKERHETYKPVGLKTCCKNLVKWSNGDQAIAQRMIDRAMGNNSQGFYPLSQADLNNIKTTQITNKHESQVGVLEVNTRYSYDDFE